MNMNFFKCLSFYIQIGLYVAVVQFVDCALTGYNEIDVIGTDFYDMDTEQSQARYDPRILSEDLNSYKDSSSNNGAPCINVKGQYVHGQKIPRADPCEICLCVDGEIFCWWKKCEHLLKKYPKKPKHHSRKTTNSWTKMFPKNVLNFPHHLPINLLGEHSRMMEHPYRVTETSTTAERHPIQWDPTTVAQIPENIFNSNSIGNLVQSTIPTTQAPPSTSIFEHDSRNINDKLRNITEKPIIIDTGTTGTYNNRDEKGYFEKTIFNKNGVFVENIRKIANIDDNVLFRAEDEANQNQENMNQKRIELMNVPVSQHYVITSSGKIEKTDTLSSSDVIDQFRESLNDYTGSHQQASSTESNGISKNNSNGTMASTNISSMDTQRQPKNETHCFVMGQTYAVGTILPQETGNCLQCKCEHGTNEEDSPRVTCSPHNCPPLILPDLFDATGY